MTTPDNDCGVVGGVSLGAFGWAPQPAEMVSMPFTSTALRKWVGPMFWERSSTSSSIHSTSTLAGRPDSEGRVRGGFLDQRRRRLCGPHPQRLVVLDYRDATGSIMSYPATHNEVTFNYDDQSAEDEGYYLTTEVAVQGQTVAVLFSQTFPNNDYDNEALLKLYTVCDDTLPSCDLSNLTARGSASLAGDGTWNVLIRDDVIYVAQVRLAWLW